MKHTQLLVFLFIISTLPLHAQIIITDADMPLPGKKYIISQSNDFNLINPALTGKNFTWDFSNLKDSVQQSDTSMPITSAPQMYQYVFNSYLDPKPTFCIHSSYLNKFDSLKQFHPTVIYEYYRNSSANYSYTGLALNLAGISVPIKYDTIDNIYTFPLTYGNSDSGKSYFTTPSIVLPYLIYTSNQKRKNEADGWGTLKTPYGSFSVLRVKSTINSVDMFYKTADSAGYQFQQPTKFEYKWLGQNTGIPLLQVNTELRNSVEVITGISYQDSFRFNSIAIVNRPKPINIRVYPNPFSQTAQVEYRIDKRSFVSVELIDLYGNVVSKLQSEYQNEGVYSIPVNIENSISGIYFIKFRLNNQVQFEKINYIR